MNSGPMGNNDLAGQFEACESDLNKQNSPSFVYVAGFGWKHIDDLPNGPLFDFSADVFSEAFGEPKDSSCDINVESEQPSLSMTDVFHDIKEIPKLACVLFHHFTEKSLSLLSSVKNVNLFGPHWVEGKVNHSPCSAEITNRKI